MHLALGLANLVMGLISPWLIAVQIVTVPLWFAMFNSYVIVNPNEAVVAQFFGKYSATLKIEGFQFFINPLYQKTKISLRINNFESNKLKVNDVNANPIDIACLLYTSPSPRD